MQIYVCVCANLAIGIVRPQGSPVFAATRMIESVLLQMLAHYVILHLFIRTACATFILEAGDTE
jgi:hypothetical protein